MVKVIETTGIPIKLWLDDIEEDALQQAMNLARLPFAYKWISVMSDAHVGYGMPIGGVLCTIGTVIPNAVGVDIGCGMCVVKTDIQEFTKDKLKQIMGAIRKTIPAGFHWHKEVQVSLDELIKKDHTDVIEEQKKRAEKQVGTLGGGNHFIDLLVDDEGYLYVMLHSGSRNLGHKTATYYNKLAKEINLKEKSEVPPEWDLAYLSLNSEEGQNYLIDMDYCVSFAYESRLLMMKRVIESIKSVFPDAQFGEIQNKAHNFARLETHYGEEVVVHRKGATSAFEGELCIIPGSQGTASYLCRGLGNEESFKSCSHGSGREMGRNEAKRTLSLEKEVKELESKGILHEIRGKADLQEAPGAYKDIEVVMKNQEDLVKIETRLFPVAVITG